MKKKSHQQGNKAYLGLKLNLKCCLSHIVTHSEDSKDFPFNREENMQKILQMYVVELFLSFKSRHEIKAVVYI